jgi:predicted DNA-binding transcriptional regulator YafY
MEDIIKTAIENKQLLSFIYKNKNRVVEPYTFGESNTGKDTLSAFQIEGGSDAYADMCWRQFPLRQIKDLKLLDTKFEEIRADYDPDNARMSFIYWTV